jgi:DNA-binding response OmpR family regulator
MDMHVQRLRRKLGDTGACIETVRGAGYRLRVTQESPR